jgi:hypothetical protein
MNERGRVAALATAIGGAPMEQDAKRDPLVEQEEQAAAEEAGGIGGDTGDDRHSEAERPLAEAGQGYAEGFEEAEEELIDRAEHGEQPHVSSISDEVESDRSTAEYGEADAIPPEESS